MLGTVLYYSFKEFTDTIDYDPNKDVKSDSDGGISKLLYDSKMTKEFAVGHQNEALEAELKTTLLGLIGKIVYLSKPELHTDDQDDEGADSMMSKSNYSNKPRDKQAHPNDEY